MYPQKYFTLNFFINEIFSVKKFPNYGICKSSINAANSWKASNMVIFSTLDSISRDSAG